MHNNIIRTTILALSAAAFISCVEVEDPQAGAVGYLSAPSLAVDVTIDDLLLTKALEFDVEAPSVDDIHFAVIDGTDNVRYECDGLWTDPIVLPVGEYTVEASAGENGFGEPYFTGSAPVSIQALGSSSPVIRLELANALVNVTVSDELKDHFIPGDKVILNPGAYEAPYGEWFYVPAGEDLTLSLAGCNSAGKEAVYEHELARTAAKTAYSVICMLSSTNWPSISWTTSPADGAFEGAVYFKPVAVSGMSDENASELVYQIRGGDYADWTDAVVSDLDDTYKYISGLSDGTPYTLRACVGNIVSQEASFTPVRLEDCLKLSTVSASHNNADDPTEELSGTTMTCCGLKADLPSVIEELTKVTASGYFNSSDNKATGSFSAELSDQLQDMTFINADGWPYLPKGDYSVTVSAACVLNGNTHTVSSTYSVPVHAPDFTVSVSAYTSYDKYLERDLDFANSVANKHTVFERKASVSISETLLTNGNYASLRSSSIRFNSNDIGVFDASSKDFGNDDKCTGWKNYPFYAVMTFDGVTKEASDDCHITGLPYSAAPPTDSDWSSSGSVNFRSGDVRFGNGGGAGSITFSKLHIPGNVNVSVSCKIDAYGAPINTTSYVEVGGSRLFECTSDSGAFDYNTVTLEDTRNGAFSSSANTVKAGTTYGLGTTRGHLYYITINYR